MWRISIINLWGQATSLGARWFQYNSLLHGWIDCSIHVKATYEEARQTKLVGVVVEAILFFMDELIVPKMLKLLRNLMMSLQVKCIWKLLSCDDYYFLFLIELKLVKYINTCYKLVLEPILSLQFFNVVFEVSMQY